MNSLPQDCIAKILSLTSPEDACRLSAVSRIFRSASDSDIVWNHFLPTDFPAGFTVPQGLPTRKHLFFSLVDNPLLLDGSQLSFWLEKRSGKKCYMIAARALNIVWGEDQRYWQWISLPNTTRLTEVADLIMVWWFDITGKINITLLSDDTLYAAYLVYKWNNDPYGFRQPVEASVFMAGTEPVEISMVSLMQNPGREEGKCGELRSDGWYEIELGQLLK